MVSLRSLLRHQEGATPIEYGLVAGLLCCAILVGSHALHEPVTKMYDEMASKTNNVFAVQPAAGPKRMTVTTRKRQ